MNFNETTLVAHNTIIEQPLAAQRYAAKPFEHDPTKPFIGKCDDAGHLIRLVLGHLGIRDLKFDQASKLIMIPYQANGQSCSETMDHDVTLVTSGDRWGVINSLSPYFTQNYVREEDLDEYYPLLLDGDSNLWDFKHRT